MRFKNIRPLESSFRGMISLGLGLILLSGCKFNTIPDVKVPESKGLDKPWEFPVEKDQGKFRLVTGNDQEVTYSPATLLILNEKLTAKDLVPMLNAAEEFRETQADYNRDYLYGEALEFDRQIKDLEAGVRQALKDITKLEAEDLARSQKDRENTAKGWLNERLLAEVADEAIRNELRDTLETYCEAKIWQLATNQIFARRFYQVRPSPMQLCEGYYTEGQDFFSHESCKDAEDPAVGQSYFACMWSAVAKTKWLDPSHGVIPESFEIKKGTDKGKSVNRLSYLMAILENPETLELFRRTMAREVIIELGQDGVIGKQMGSLSRNGFGNLMNQTAVRCKEQPTKTATDGTIGPESYYVEFLDLCTMFVRNRTLPTLPDGASTFPGVYLTPDQAIRMVELTDTTTRPYERTINGVTKSFQIPMKETPSGDLSYKNAAGVVLTVPRADVYTYHNLIRYFGARTWIGISEFDLDFHQPPTGRPDLDQYGDPIPSPSKPLNRYAEAHKSDLYKSDEVKIEFKTNSTLKTLYPTPDPAVIEQIEGLKGEIEEMNQKLLKLPKDKLARKELLEKAPNDAKDRASNLTWSPYRPMDSEDARFLYRDHGDVCKTEPYLFPDDQALCTDDILELRGDRCKLKYQVMLRQMQDKGFGLPIALASIEVTMKMAKKGDILKIDMWNGNRSAEDVSGHVVACASIESGEPIPCEQSDGFLAETIPGKLRYHKATGRINFEFAADADYPSFSQEGVRVRFFDHRPMIDQFCGDETYFQELSDDMLVGRTIELEMYGDTQTEFLNILTGKLMIKAPGHDPSSDRYEYEGAVSAISNVNGNKM